MLLKAKCSNSRKWGFVERYDVYRYFGKGYIRALVSVSLEGVLSPVYVFRGGEFIPLGVIDGEVGIDRYIRAKKPFYSLLSSGFVVELRAEVDFVSRVYYPDKSSYGVYVMNGNPGNLEKGLPFKKVLDVPKEFDRIVEEPLRILGESFGDREVFLRGRIID